MLTNWLTKAIVNLTIFFQLDTIILLTLYLPLFCYFNLLFRQFYYLFWFSVQRKLRSASFALNNLKYCSTNSIMRIIYFSLVESHLRYGIAAWGSSTFCSTLQRSHKRVLKLLQNQNEFLTIENIYKLTIINEFHNVPTLRERVEHTQNTRWRLNGRYKIPKFSNNFGRRTLECTVPRICNSLPISILNITLEYHRKKRLKSYLLQQQQPQAFINPVK